MSERITNEYSSKLAVCFKAKVSHTELYTPVVLFQTALTFSSCLVLKDSWQDCCLGCIFTAPCDKWDLPVMLNLCQAGKEGCLGEAASAAQWVMLIGQVCAFAFDVRFCHQSGHNCRAFWCKKIFAKLRPDIYTIFTLRTTQSQIIMKN